MEIAGSTKKYPTWALPFLCKAILLMNSPLKIPIAYKYRRWVDTILQYACYFANSSSMAFVASAIASSVVMLPAIAS